MIVVEKNDYNGKNENSVGIMKKRPHIFKELHVLFSILTLSKCSPRVRFFAGFYDNTNP